MKSNIIQLSFYQSSPQPVSATPHTFNYKDFNLRAKKRFRRAAVCQIIGAAVDAVVTFAIGLCVLTGTAAFILLL